MPDTIMNTTDEKALNEEIIRLKKIINALMNQAERSMTGHGSDFGFFQTTILLEDQIKERTRELEIALRENEKYARTLKLTTQRMQNEIQERLQVEESLRQSEGRYHTATEAANDAFITFDENHRIILANSATERILGYTKEELYTLEMDQLLKPGSDRNLSSVFSGIESNQLHPGMESVQLTLLHRNGHEIPVEFSCGEYLHNGKRYFTGVARDITERVRTEALQIGHQQVLELIALNVSLERVLVTLIGHIEAQSPGILCMAGLLDTEKGSLQEIIAPGLPKEYLDTLIGFMPGPEAASCGTAMYRRKPVFVSDIMTDPLWTDYRQLAQPYGMRACWSMPIISGKNELLGSFAVYYREARSPTNEEIRLIEFAVRIATIAIERKRDEADILHMARHDALTGLPNRILLEDRILQSITQARRDRNSVAVLFIDLDNFKPINDRYGHRVGDMVLMEAANRMRNCLRDGDSVARLGGDEFVICLPQMAGGHDALTVAGKIHASLAKPMHVGGHRILAGSSIGISLYPDNGDSPEQLIQAADEAMYAVKNDRSGGFRLHSASPATPESRDRSPAD